MVRHGGTSILSIKHGGHVSGAARLPRLCHNSGVRAEANRRGCSRPSCVCAPPHSRGSGPAVKVRLRGLVNLQDLEAQLRGLLNLGDLEAQLRWFLNLRDIEAQLRNLPNMGDYGAQSCCAPKVREWISMTSGLDSRKCH